ncbi:MAG: hypothetical protein KAZ36_01780 [Bacteroidales bacterium]|nr:hypothetical protein [Bacteroidales bacterium]
MNTIITIMLSSIVGGSMSWVFLIGSKKKIEAAKAEGEEIGNAKEIVSFYKNVFADQNKRITDLESEIKQIKNNLCIIVDCPSRKR